MAELPHQDRSSCLDKVREIVGADWVRTGHEDLETYGRDWTRVYEPKPLAIVFPKSTEEVAGVVRVARDHHVAIVPSGGRTGLAAGAVAANGELVVSLERMRAMGEVDVRARTVVVEAGAVTSSVHAHTEPHGLTWPVDFASKGSSQVGGNIATNAGGVKVIRYGLTRDWVLGLEVVTGRGDVLNLNGALVKNNTGIDLRQLFIGSEGTLGIVTRATLRLAPLPGHLDVLLLSVADLAGVLALFERARRSTFLVSAFEFFTDRCQARLKRHRGISMPLSVASSHYVLIELEGVDSEALDEWLATLLEDGVVLDGTRAEHGAQRRALWELREGISESLSATGMPHKNDIALPIAALEGFCAELDALFAREWPGYEICLFGHIGDGNLHVNVMKPDDMEKADFLAWAKVADRSMFELVERFSGSVSAEHGIGLLKRDALRFSRTPLEIEIMRATKKALDPDDIMNPGKVFDVG